MAPNFDVGRRLISNGTVPNLRVGKSDKLTIALGLSRGELQCSGAGCYANRNVVIERCSEIGKKIPAVRQCNCTPEISSCQTLQLCNDCAVAADYRGFIKVDEVDGRSPVERAAATFVPDLRGHCAGRKTKSAAEFFAALRSFQD